MKFIISKRAWSLLLLPAALFLFYLSRLNPPGLVESGFGRIAEATVEKAPMPEDHKSSLPANSMLTIEQVQKFNPLRHGLLGKLYKGTQFDKSPLQKSFITSETSKLVDPDNLPLAEPFSIVFEGHILIDRSGTYVFATTSDDASFLYLNGGKIVDNGGSHAAQKKISSSIRLTSGYHHFKLEYNNIAYGGMLSLEMGANSASLGPIPSDKIFHRSELDESTLLKTRSLIFKRMVNHIYHESDQPLETPYYRNWPTTKFEFPSERLDYLDIEWEGWLYCPVEGDYSFEIPQMWHCQITIDNQTYRSFGPNLKEHQFHLKRGYNAFKLHAEKSPDRKGIRLNWKLPKSKDFRSIAPHYFSLVENPSFIKSNWQLFFIGLTLLSCIGFIIFLIIHIRGGSKEWQITKKSIKQDFPKIAILFILICAAILRFHDLTYIPRFLEVEDEYQFIWSGYNLVKNGYPEAWSIWSLPKHFKDGNILQQKWWGHPFTIVRPWFDHPPLFSLLVAIPVVISGENNIWKMWISGPRALCVLLSIMCLPFIYSLGKRWGNKSIGLISCLVYAITPTFVVSARLVKPEILIGLSFLITLWAFEKQKDNAENKLYPLLIGVVSGLSFLAKIPGIACFLASFITYCSRKMWKSLIIMSSTFIVFVALLLFYVWYYGWHEFIITSFKAQAVRNIGFDVFKILLTSSHVTWQTEVLGFGLILFLWLALFSALRVIPDSGRIMFITYLLVVLGSCNKDFFFGWYRVPFDPLLSLGAGIILYRMWEDLSFHWLILFSLLVFLGALLTAFPALHQPGHFRLALMLSVSPFFLGKIFGKFKVSSGYLRAIILIQALATIYLLCYIIWHLQRIY